MVERGRVKVPALVRGFFRSKNPNVVEHEGDGRKSEDFFEALVKKIVNVQGGDVREELCARILLNLDRIICCLIQNFDSSGNVVRSTILSGTIREIIEQQSKESVDEFVGRLMCETAEVSDSGAPVRRQATELEIILCVSLMEIQRTAVVTRLLDHEDFQYAVMQTFEVETFEVDAFVVRDTMVLVHGSEFKIGTHFNRAMEEDVAAVSAHVERKALFPAQVYHHPRADRLVVIMTPSCESLKTQSG
jgi:hypothetical protein